MLSIKLDILLFLMICRVSNCQRRIVDGARVSTPKPYVVYLVKANDLSERNYDYWLCGGAIVSNDFIITSAACVEDVQYLYVVAGYDRYVTNDNLDNHKCIEEKKKKVIYTCVPLSYDFDFDDIEKWSRIDIALAKVDKPYDFNDESYQTICRYIPKKILVNFDPRYQVPDTDCMVMGWGHSAKWRKHRDRNNYNSDVLKYTSTLVIDKKSCLDEFQYYPNMTPIIEQYMICTNGSGKIDDGGEPYENSTPFDLLDSCAGRRMDQQNSSCKGDDDNLNIDFMNIRRAVPKTNRTYHYNYTTSDFIKDARSKAFNRTRRNGICQNDHGGPLVTWVGTTEVLIGVASVFKIDGDNNCIGPYLHTSTQSSYDFISCILNSEETRRSPLCDSPPSVRGFDMIENHISWKDHPAGPAENELREAKLNPYNT